MFVFCVYLSLSDAGVKWIDVPIQEICDLEPAKRMFELLCMHSHPQVLIPKELVELKDPEDPKDPKSPKKSTLAIAIAP